MHTQELMFFVRFQGCIHIPHRDLLRTAEQDCAAGSPGHRQNPCLLQGAEQVADHHRIAAGAGCSPVLVIRRPSNTAMQIRQCSAMEHLVLMRMVFHLWLQDTILSEICKLF